MECWQKQLNDREANNALRKLSLPNDNLIDFCSNDYLGFAKNAFHQSSNNGSGGSRLLSGNTHSHEKAETYIAKFHGFDSALLFNSGYTANLGLISTIINRHDVILYDELSHASIRDGIQITNAKSFSFTHNNTCELEKKLKQHSQQTCWVITESVFSMDGDQAPLTEIAALCEQYNALLIVDEAHAVGVIGDKGIGLVGKLNLQDKVTASVVTFGKALGCHGAAVLCSELLKNYLINFCRAFIYTTAMPSGQAQHIHENYKLLETVQAQTVLQRNILLFQDKVMHVNGYIKSNSAIQSIIISGNNRVKQLAEELTKHNFDVKPILSPTVPLGKERIRICLHAFNTELQIEELTNCITQYEL